MENNSVWKCRIISLILAVLLLLTMCMGGCAFSGSAVSQEATSSDSFNFDPNAGKTTSAVSQEPLSLDSLHFDPNADKLTFINQYNENLHYTGSMENPTEGSMPICSYSIDVEPIYVLVSVPSSNYYEVELEGSDVNFGIYGTFITNMHLRGHGIYRVVNDGTERKIHVYGEDFSYSLSIQSDISKDYLYIEGTGDRQLIFSVSNGEIIVEE